MGLQYVNNELHWREIVIEHHDLVELRGLDLLRLLLDNGRALPLSARCGRLRRGALV